MRASDLTVAIPTRDRWEILQRTLAALRAQTVNGFETIVVCDGEELRPPPDVRALPGVRLLNQAHAGPGVARNLAAHASDRRLLLFLGDDMVPEPDLVARHLERHALDPAPEAAVLGRVQWHPEVPDSRLMRWLEWSGAQFDYRQLDRERVAGGHDHDRELGPGGQEAGFGRFYSCNVSIKRELFLQAGGFDPAFTFDYEDLDLGWRLDRLGMRLLYEPRALAWHLHAHDWSSVERRYVSRARAERLMLAKHDWFAPWFHDRIRAHAAQPSVSRLWPGLAGLVPERPGRLRVRVEARADRFYHQRLAPAFLAAWDAERDLEELRAYLGDGYEQDKLAGHRQLVDAEAQATGDELRFYHSSQLYLYDLTAFAMSGAKDPYRRQLQSVLAPGSRLLDYGCGIGSDGLRLIEAGYRVEFADFDNPSTRYLRWRLDQRGLLAGVHDLDGEVPRGFDGAYAFDVIEHVDDPFAFLAELERRAAIVAVNLLEPVPDDTPLHRPLPIGAILDHAAQRGLLRHRRYHGRSHLIVYRAARAPAHASGASPGRAGVARLRSTAERRLGPYRRAG